MSLYDSSIPQLKTMLENLDGWLGKAIEFAATKSFDPNTLLTARLAPDQFPLVRQVQNSCDHAKFTAARLTGKEAPKNPDTEQTMDELRQRIRTTITYLDTFKPEDFAGAETRRIALSFFEGKVILGSAYLSELALPNFYFHITTAYAILRHNGLDLGKRNFIGRLTLLDA